MTIKEKMDFAIDRCYIGNDIKQLFGCKENYYEALGLENRKINLPSIENLNNKQKEVLDLVNNTKGNLFLILHGGVRSGKTYIAMYLFILKIMNSPKNSLFLATGYNLNSLRTNIEQVLDDLGLQLNVDYRYNGLSYRYSICGSTVRLCGANNKRSYSNIKGCTAIGWYANEATEQDKSVIDQCHLRVSKGDTFKIWDTNPSHCTHYIYQDYILKAEKKNILVKHFVTEDNIEQLTPGYIEEQRMMLSEEAAKVYLEGQWLETVDMPFYKLKEVKISHAVLQRSVGRKLAFLDPATGYGENSSKSALSIIIEYRDDLYFFGKLFNGLWSTHLSEIAYILNSFHLNAFFYENNLIGEGAVELDHDFCQLFRGRNIQSIRNTTNKIARISNLVQPITKEQLVVTDFCDKDYADSIRFSNLKDPKSQLDAIDSLESCYRSLFE